MKILIRLTSDNELISYESLALAFILATFDHKVQLFVTKPTDLLLTDKQSRLHGMIQSLDLYDMNKAWHDFDDDTLALFDDEIKQALDDERKVFEDESNSFESVLEF